MTMVPFLSINRIPSKDSSQIARNRSSDNRSWSSAIRRFSFSFASIIAFFIANGSRSSLSLIT
ncbi:MAG TPA: hypothetical protein DCQ28_07805 [Bacteroidetes bacterium]|nr:hypothetical protein [Bacteroidota bacterium]